MNELPEEARALLELARDGHEPPAGAKERVQARVIAAVAVSAAAGMAGKAIATGAKKGLLASLGAKTAAASAAAVIVAGSLLVVPPLLRAPSTKRAVMSAAQVPHPPHADKGAAPAVTAAEIPAAQADSETTGPTTAPAAAAAEPTEVQAEPKFAAASSGAKPPAHVDRKARTRPSVEHPPIQPAAGPQSQPELAPPDPLREEMRLLRGASAALDRGDTIGAEQYLAEHRQRFGARAMLVAEQRALSAIVRCLRGERGAARAAERLLREGGASVLASRLRSSCHLQQEEP